MFVNEYLYHYFYYSLYAFFYRAGYNYVLYNYWGQQFQLSVFHAFYLVYIIHIPQFHTHIIMIFTNYGMNNDYYKLLFSYFLPTTARFLSDFDWCYWFYIAFAVAVAVAVAIAIGNRRPTCRFVNISTFLVITV